MLDRNLKLIDRECSTCMRLINREIRVLEDDVENKQMMVRRTHSACAAEERRQKQKRVAEDKMKQTFNLNMNKLNRFDLAKDSPTPAAAADVTARPKPPLTKHLSATARLSNASETDLELTGRRAFSAKSSSTTSSSRYSGPLVIQRPRSPMLASRTKSILKANSADYDAHNSLDSPTAMAILPLKTAPISVSTLRKNQRPQSSGSMKSKKTTASNSSISSVSFTDPPIQQKIEFDQDIDIRDDISEADADGQFLHESNNSPLAQELHLPQLS